MRGLILALCSLALATVVVMAAAGCDDGSQGKASLTPSQFAAPSVAGLVRRTPSPSPTARPVLDAAARFSSIHSAEVPAASEEEGWSPLQLIPGSHAFLVYVPPRFLDDCGGCQFPPGDPDKPGRLALWDVQTGEIDEFRAMEIGKQAVSTGSDGRFLVWAEGGYGSGGWRLYALELSTMQWWQVDTDFGIVSGDSWIERGDLSLAVGSGWLVYAAAIGNFSGYYIYELRVYDLTTRTGRVLELSGDAPTGHIGSSKWGTSQAGVVMEPVSPLRVDENGRVIWLGPRLVNYQRCDCDSLYGLYSTDLSTGETNALITEATKQDLDLLRSVTGDSQGRDPGQSRWAEYIQMVGGFLLWANRPENEAMAFELDTGDLIKLSDCDVDRLAADNDRIYWACGESLYWVDTD